MGAGLTAWHSNTRVKTGRWRLRQSSGLSPLSGFWATREFYGDTDETAWTGRRKKPIPPDAFIKPRKK